MSGLVRQYSLRIILSLIISLGLGYLISEGSFLILNQGKPPENQDYVLVIPAGTAERLEKGLSNATIPENMVFYEGDRIIVRNEDSTSHQLGPVWVPAGSTGTLDLGQQKKYSISCSFQPNKTLGLDIRPKTSSGTRIQGVLAIGLPSAVLMFLFSIVLWPIDDQKKEVCADDK